MKAQAKDEMTNLKNKNKKLKFVNVFKDVSKSYNHGASSTLCLGIQLSKLNPRFRCKFL
jgi:hypothetical protein